MKRPSHAETPADLSRRSFLELLGFSLAVAGCSRAPAREAIPFVDHPEPMLPGEALHYATTCAACAAGCGLLVKTRDGRAIKVEGNPEAPVGGGGTCALGQASVLGLYDEARLRGPLWQGEATPWPEIDRRIGKRLDAMATRGQGIAIVTGGTIGPATDDLVGAWCARFPRTRRIAYEPASTAAIRRAHRLAYGVPVVPRYRFERARAVVGLEADFLGTWLSPVAFARGWAAGRRPRPGMSWHAQFESRLSPTGAKADLRVPVRPSAIGGIAHALYVQLTRAAGRPTQPSPFSKLPDGADEALIERTAAELWSRRGAALVVCGQNDAAVQLVVAAINDLLGGIGTTVDLGVPTVPGRDDDGGLAELIEDMGEGGVHGLILFGANPVYDTCLGSEFAAAMAYVPLSVSFADRRDATARLATAVCPDHHPLESWRDGEPMSGRRTLAQPTMRPLFDTRAAQASLLAWMGRTPDWYGFLREAWRRASGHVPGTAFDTFWNRAVHDGWAAFPTPTTSTPTPFAGDLDSAATTLALRAEVAAATRDPQRLDLVLHQRVALRDGRWANNPWLQELPDPISRTAWGNEAAIAPAVAERLGIADGDVLRLEAGSRHIELPALIQPGQADQTVAVALGYGRRHAGPAAAGVGADAYPLVGHEDGFFRYAGTVALTPVGHAATIARAQRHDRLEGRPIIKETTLEEWLEDPTSGNRDRPDPLRLWPAREVTGHRWGMSIDLNACVGCAACVIACQAENNVPVVGPEEAARGRAMHWIRIDRYASGPRPDTAFQPMMCQHCADAPCESVCPVLATVHSSDGLNQQVYNRCIGTRYCANNCPYKVRRFNWFNYARNDRFDYHMNDDLGILVLNPDVVVRSRGVMEKCSMCVQRIQAGTLGAELEGRALRDGDIETACQQACPTDAIRFGDLADPDSAVAEETRDPRFYRVLEELGVGPAVGYQTLVRHRKSSDEARGPSRERA